MSEAWVCRLIKKADSQALADIHAQAFDAPWDAKTIDGWISHPFGVAGVVFAQLDEANIVGFALCLKAGDDLELLTIAISPEHRRLGLARRLLETIEGEATDLDVSRWILEVAKDNQAALHLYEGMNFKVIATRSNYYNRSTGAVDALVMSRPIAGRASE